MSEKISEAQAKSPQKKTSKKTEAMIQAKLRERKEEFFRESQEIIQKFNREKMILLDLGKAWQSRQTDFEAIQAENVLLKAELEKIRGTSQPKLASEPTTAQSSAQRSEIESLRGQLAEEQEKSQVLESLVQTHQAKICKLDEQIDLYASQVGLLLQKVDPQKNGK